MSSVLVLPRGPGGLLPVMDLIWGWFISRLSSAIKVQRRDLRALTSKAQTALCVRYDERWHSAPPCVGPPVCWRLWEPSAHLKQCVCSRSCSLWGLSMCPFCVFIGVELAFPGWTTSCICVCVTVKTIYPAEQHLYAYSLKLELCEVFGFSCEVFCFSFFLF